MTAADARMILRNAVGLEALDRSQLLLADMDFSGDVSAADARMALRAAVGLEELQTY